MKLGKRVIPMFWPGSEAPIQGASSNTFKKFKYTGFSRNFLMY